MPEITWSAIALAFGMLPAAQREILRNTSIEVCIFKKAEFKAYTEKLSEKKSFSKVFEVSMLFVSVFKLFLDFPLLLWGWHHYFRFFDLYIICGLMG